MRFRVKAHGSELEYSMRGRPELERWGARVARRARRRSSSAPSTSATCSRRSSATSTAWTRCRRASTSRSSGPQPRESALAALLAEARGATRRIPATARSGCPTRATPQRLARFFAGERPTVVYFGKLIENKGVQVLLEALDGLDARAVIVGFGDYRGELERAARRRARSSPGRSSTATSCTCCRSCDVAVVPSIFPEAFGMVAAEAAAGGRAAGRRARTRASPRWPPGSSEEYPAGRSATSLVPDRRRRRPARARSRELLALPAAERRALGPPPAAPSSERWSWAGVAARLAATPFVDQIALRARWARSSGSATEEHARAVARGVRAVPDFTVAVEEEFALLDPETLGLVNRFEERPGGGAGHRRSSRTSSAS